MSLDRKLRDGLDRATTPVDPDVERHLHQSLRRGHRGIRLRRAATTVPAAVAIVAAVAFGPRVLDVIGDRGTPAERPTPSVVPTSPLVGNYTTTLPERPGTIAETGMAGRWDLRLEPNGVVLLSAPPGFPGTVSAVSYEAEGSRFRINAFANDLCSTQSIGTYRWAREGSSVNFTPIEDPCAVRMALLTTRPWRLRGQWK